MNRTFTIIKPNAVANGYTGKILDIILSEGFVIRAMKMTYLNRNDAEKFYSDHRGKPFFNRLVKFMTSGSIVVAILEREDAVRHLREVVGNTDPRKAAEGTIRRLFAESLTRNAIHASDSEDNAAKEWGQFFTEHQIIDTDYMLPCSAAEIDAD